MNEMDWNIIDHRFVVGESVHRGFVLAPIVRIAPILDEFL
jgi:hypothetical protein